MYIAGNSRYQTDRWMREVVRNLTFDSGDLIAGCGYLLRDRDAMFTAGVDIILRSAGIESVLLPPPSPNLNAVAERLVRTIKDECLERMNFFGEASLRHAVTEYVAHH